jgi:hypothetical protein
MRRHPGRADLVVSTIALSIAVLVLNVAASSAQDRSGSDGKAAASPASRLPANYRRGGTYAAVCVAIFRDNPFGIVVRDNWVLTFDNGQVKDLAYGLEKCSDFSSFTELMQR